MPNFGQMKDMYAMAKKAKQMQKELKNLEIEAKSEGGEVGVIVNGEMKLIDIEINEYMLDKSKKTELEQLIKETVAQALSRAQSESASRMQPMLKDLNIPGM